MTIIYNQNNDKNRTKFSCTTYKTLLTNFLEVLFYFWYWLKALKGVEHGRLWSNKKFRGAFQFEGLYRKMYFLKVEKGNFAKSSNRRFNL